MFRRSIAAGALAAGLLLGSASANANLLLNPGFETGTFANWSTTGDTSIGTCAFAVMGCAPGGGAYSARINDFTANGNGSIIQTVILPGPGDYSFGAYLSFGTNNPAGNFDQGQISLTVQIAGGPSEAVGFDPNALNGQFTIAGNFGLSFTPWMLLTDTLTYSGVGPASALFNLNVQDFTAGGLILIADNTFIEAAAVPEPGTLLLLASGLLGLGAAVRRRKRG